MTSPFDSSNGTRGSSSSRPAGSYNLQRTHSDGVPLSTTHDRNHSVDDRASRDAGPRHGVNLDKPPLSPATTTAGLPGSKGAFDTHDFPTLGQGPPSSGNPPKSPGYTPSIAPYKQGYLASRGSSGWTSRLADAPPPDHDDSAPGTAMLQRATSAPRPTTPTAVAPVLSAATVAPRMADAIKQAAAATNGGNGSTIQPSRLETLERRQSRTLIPVVAGSKAKANTATASNAAIAGSTGPLKFPQPLQKLEKGLRRPQLEVSTSNPVPLMRLNTSDKVLSLVSPTSAAPAAAKAVAPLVLPEEATSVDSCPPLISPIDKQRQGQAERERHSFFAKLRRAKSLTSNNCNNNHPEHSGDSMDAANGVKGGADGHKLSPNGVTNGMTNGPVDALVSLSISNSSSVHNDEEVAMPAASLADCNGNDAHNVSCGVGEGGKPAAGGVPELSEEEEAFLKSLGWTAADDEDEEGLTEEEIAAFRAAAQARANSEPQAATATTAPSRPPVSSPCMLRTSLPNGVAAVVLAASYDSDISSSDSDDDD